MAFIYVKNVCELECGGEKMQTRLEQTWKKLQAVQAALADILSEITLF